ncbi:exocyst complex component EXO70A1-like [Cornus florida]|uniref:exocyst complex component EXO70A1-like n=1 Tax=Cornus florida TaxID=4283 RepID=UPI0028A1B247|nr:exocyst complex component EXO70A1-like [Cornus florida]
MYVCSRTSKFLNYKEFIPSIRIMIIKMVFKFLKFCRNNQPQATTLPENVVPESSMEVVLNGHVSKIDHHLQAADETESTTISADGQSKSNSAIQISNIAQLENEFRVILISLTCPTGTNPGKSSTSSCSITDSAPSYEHCNFVKLNREKKDDLRSIAERMNSAGILGKGIEVYQSVRKTFLETSLWKLGIQKLTMNDIRSLEWEELQEKIRRWIQAAKIWVSVLFASEKRLCKHVFGGLGNAIVDDNCFAETVKDPAFQLFETGKALSICTSNRSRRPEKLFRILDLHQMLLQLSKDLDIIFRSKSLEAVAIEAAEMLLLLDKAAGQILPEFENSMLHAQFHFQDHEGGIDTLTTYVMSYITQIAYYKRGLTKLVVSKPEYGRNICGHMTILDMELSELDGRTSTPLMVHLIWIIEILQFKLEAISKRYKEASLAQLFLMNNVHYIVEKIKEHHDLGKMVGDAYLKMLIEKVQLLMNAYMGSTWDRVIYCLRDEGLYASRGRSSKVSKRVLKERFKTFNATVEEVRQNQAKWVVPNQKIRIKLRHSISEKLIPTYSSFFKRFTSHLGNENQQEKYIKYKVKDLKIVISNFKNG